MQVGERTERGEIDLVRVVETGANPMHLIKTVRLFLEVVSDEIAMCGLKSCNVESVVWIFSCGYQTFQKQMLV